jgi:hypothetical protein
LIHSFDEVIYNCGKGIVGCLNVSGIIRSVEGDGKVLRRNPKLPPLQLDSIKMKPVRIECKDMIYVDNFALINKWDGDLSSAKAMRVDDSNRFIRTAKKINKKFSKNPYFKPLIIPKRRIAPCGFRYINF